MSCRQQVYDHRLRRFIYQSGDISVALKLGVPRSTAAGWLASEPPQVVSLSMLDMDTIRLQRKARMLEHRLEVMKAVFQLLLSLVKVLGARLERRRLADDGSKALLLRTVERALRVLPLTSALKVLGLSASRYHSWRREMTTCNREDARCPRTNPNQLNAKEISVIREMVTSPEYRHVPTGRLALLAQRLGKVVASPSTWYRLVRERQWRRPRRRIHHGKWYLFSG